jgi:hypothetical protein
MPSLFLPEVALQATSSSGKPNIKWLHSSGCQNQRITSSSSAYIFKKTCKFLGSSYLVTPPTLESIG